MSSRIRILSVTKHFGGQPVLTNVSLDVAPGEVVTLIGPSGCGKSTLLRLLAGLEDGHEGTLLVDGAPAAAARRSLGLMFQEPRLMPWLSVRDNALFGVRPPVPAAVRARADELLELVGLAGAADQLPKQLSGGMAQRAALARALVAEPTALLLDEPFSAVDAITRLQLQDLLLSTWQRTQLTMLLVTHDLDEALALSDRVVVLSGRPAAIAEVIDVRLPRPRERNSLDFLRLRARLFGALHLAKAQPGRTTVGGTPFGV
jgi:ABC-type nitrate/sulfonate/bicarbonate transport system ATPase subunit